MKCCGDNTIILRGGQPQVEEVGSRLSSVITQLLKRCDVTASVLWREKKMSLPSCHTAMTVQASSPSERLHPPSPLFKGGMFPESIKAEIGRTVELDFGNGGHLYGYF